MARFLVRLIAVTSESREVTIEAHTEQEAIQKALTQNPISSFGDPDDVSVESVVQLKGE